MGKTVYCLSNGSFDHFPNNTLTKFGNKFPFLFDYHSLIETFKFHIALEAIGFSLNLEKRFLPENAQNPSIILILKTSVKIPSMCFSLTEDFDKSCYIQPLDDSLKGNIKNSTDSFVYLYLDSNDLTYQKIILFFSKLTQHLSFTALHNENEGTLKLKYKDVSMFALFNMNLLDFIDVETSFYSDVGSKLVQELIHLWKEKSYRIKGSKKIGGDSYFHFRIDETAETILNLKSLLKPKLPKIIKVKCNEIKDQILNESSSKDLIIFCPEINKTDKFFWHEFEAKSYCVLQNTLLQNITFELTDENDLPLPLLSGIPTLLKLDIQAMEKSKKSFNVRITSNTKLHPLNTRSAFTVTLPQTLSLNTNWKAGLSSVNLPNSFNTLPSEVFMGFIYYVNVNGEGKKLEKVEHFFPHKRYSKEELFNEINFFLQKNSKNLNIGELSEKYPENQHEKVACLQMNYHGSISMSKSLAELLGFNSLILQSKKDRTYFTFNSNSSPQKTMTEFFGEQPVNIDYYRPTYYMLYSNMVQPTAVSGEYLNVLKVFPVSNNDTSYVIQEFKHREYLSLNNYEIKEITFHLRSHTGEFISFDNNKKDPVILNLHFTNYSQ